MDITSAKDKVAKLMALAKDSGATASEAERALSQAEALMRKFGIEQAECVLAGAAPDFEWGSQFTPYGNKYHQAATIPMWYQFVATGIANFTDTIVKIHDSPQGKGVGFYGEKSDIAFAVWLMDYLRDIVQQTAASQPLERSEREAFRKGMASRLAIRLRSLRKERDQAYQQSSSTALVVVSDKLAKRDAEFGAASYQTTQVRATSAQAASLGRSAADKVSFNRPLGNAAPNRARLAA